MFTWDNSPGCNLTPFFMSNSAPFTCDLSTNNPNLKLQFQMFGLPYREIDFVSIIPAFLEMVQNKCEIKLFKLDPSNDKIEFTGSNCSNVNINETDAFSEFADDVEFLIRILEKNQINIYLRNENFHYDLENKDLMVNFGRQQSIDPFQAYYSNRYIDLIFENGSNSKLNMTEDFVEFWSGDLAGQSIKARFVAQWAFNFFDIYNLIARNFGLEISIDFKKLNFKFKF